MNLSLVITLKSIDANIHGLFSPLEIINDRSESTVIASKILMRLNFGSVGWDDSLSNSLAHSCNLTASDMLLLNLLILSCLSHFSCFSVLLVSWVCLSSLDVNLWLCLINCRLSRFNLFLNAWRNGSFLLLNSFIDILSLWYSLSLLNDILIFDWLGVVLLSNWAKILLLIVVTSVRFSIIVRRSVWLNSNLLVSFNNVSWRWNICISRWWNIHNSSVLLLQPELGMEVVWVLVGCRPPVH